MVAAPRRRALVLSRAGCRFAKVAGLGYCFRRCSQPKAERAMSASGGIGRRARFRSVCPKGRGGSTPPSRTAGGSLKCVPPVHRTPDQMPLIGSSVIPSPPDTRPHASRGCRGPPDLHSHVILAMRMPLPGVSGQGLLPGGLSTCGPWWLATSPSCQSASEAVGPSPGVARCRVWGSGVGVVFDRHDQQLGAVGLLCWVERGR